ncbi:MAG: hypothetical protein V4650_04095 [Pseudomonadota bacterium]
MSLTYGFATTKDLFAKLERDAEALNKHVTSDQFFNFVVTGYSMIDWVRNDPSIPTPAKDAVVVQNLYDDKWIKVCGDLATASKHFALTRRIPITASADTAQGYGVGRYGVGKYGIGEESILVQMNDGNHFHCLDLVTGVLESWRSFFLTYGI